MSFCGISSLYQGETPKSFRISVYHPFSVPDWYKESIVYQIYPDRFARAESDPPLKEIGRALGRKTEDWDTPPYYIRKEDGSIAQWNFWGGTLKGIESRLPYIRSLGASIIYLNPIFKARSNHRYDTADYFETDPMLGTEEDFRSLCCKATELGIRIILDGVFNHTGCDSDYFRLHKDWYLKDDDGSVKCWWGVKDLPEIDESNVEFRELISEISMLMCYEATRDLPLEDVEIKTPMATMTAKKIAGRKLALVPILRAGCGMLDAMLRMVPSAKVGHIGLYRDEVTHKPVEYYNKLPGDVEERDVFVLDPSLSCRRLPHKAINPAQELCR